MISSIENELGKEFALCLASKGLNLIIIIHEETDDVKEFIRSLSTKFGIEIETLNVKTLNRCSSYSIDKHVSVIKSNEIIEDNQDKKSNGDLVDKRNISPIRQDQSDQTDVFDKIMKKNIGILINCSDYLPKRMNKFLSYSDEVSY